MKTCIPFVRHCEEPYPNFMLSDLRIIIVLETLELGGAERQASILARELKAQGCHVEVWGFTNGGVTTAILDRHEIPWHYVRLRENSSLDQILSDFGTQLQSARPDVLISYTMSPNLVCALVWRSIGARLCIWNQSDVLPGGRNPQLELRALAQVPVFISNSSHAGQFLVSNFGVKQELVRVIRNGVEIAVPDMDRARARQYFNIPDDSLVACMIANLSETKDHFTLLQAWRLVIDKLERENSVPLLLLAGRDAGMLTSLQGLAGQLRLETSVRFLGYVENIPNLLSAVDLGVFSSRSEGCPNGILESMAAEKAIVATDIPGVREAVGVEGYPYLAPPVCAESLAHAVVELFTRPALRDRLGGLNRKRIEVEFPVSRMCEETTSLILNHLSA
jgi:glycosyltransferase involved in cell wall biosynthesis